MKERGKRKKKKREENRMLLRNTYEIRVHAPRPIRRSQFCRERLNYDTIESNSQPFNRNRRGFLVPEAKRSISRDTVDARHGARYTGGENEVDFALISKIEHGLDLRFDEAVTKTRYHCSI